MYSKEETEQMVLYLDGFRRDIGVVSVVVNLTFLPCPVGFVQSGDECVCEDRLQRCTDQCIIGDKDNYFTKKSGSVYWIGYSNDSDLGVGLVLYPICPVNYCSSFEMNCSLTDLSIQCAHNHSVILCGSFTKNYI